MKPEPQYAIAAEFLTGAHIGRVISFEWTFPSSHVHAVVTGELRQVYHVSGETTLNLCAHEEYSDLEEFTLSGDTAIVVTGTPVRPTYRDLSGAEVTK